MSSDGETVNDLDIGKLSFEKKRLMTSKLKALRSIMADARYITLLWRRSYPDLLKLSPRTREKDLVILY